MAQPPVQLDAIQVEPGSGDTLKIERDSGDGSLLFTDAVVTSGITLETLAGLKAVSSVLTVGQSSTGVGYTSIQNAIDAVPSTSSLTDPTLILVYPGVYNESLIIEKDGIFLVGLGGAVVSVSSGPAVTVQASVNTPNYLRIQGLRIENSGAGEECILVNGGASSNVGSTLLHIKNCDLVASGVGGFQLVASTVNNLLLDGGSFQGSDNASQVRITQCSRFEMVGVDQVFHVQMDYDNGNPQPSILTSEYVLKNVALSGDILSTLTGVGSLSLHGVSGGPDVTMGGDRELSSMASVLGAIVVNGTSSAVLRSSSRTTIAGAGTVAEDRQIGTLSFAASASENVSFSVDQPDDQYQVSVETELTESVGVTSKTSSGFTLSFSAPQTTTISYEVSRKQ